METYKTETKIEKYLTFMLENKEYGIRILKIKEIIRLMDITHLPHTPDFIKGVINLRGKVIPVMDLRLKFDMPSREYDERTCIVVVEISTKTNVMLMGIVVDAVLEVMNISNSDIEPPPKFGSNVDTEFISGIAKTKNGIKILLDIDKVLTQEEIGSVAQTMEAM